MVSHLLAAQLVSGFFKKKKKKLGFLYPMFHRDGHQTQRAFGHQKTPRRKIFNYLDPGLDQSLVESGDQIYLQIRCVHIWMLMVGFKPFFSVEQF
jgi:hypothetical protein